VQIKLHVVIYAQFYRPISNNILIYIEPREFSVAGVALSSVLQNFGEGVMPSWDFARMRCVLSLWRISPLIMTDFPLNHIMTDFPLRKRRSIFELMCIFSLINSVPKISSIVNPLQCLFAPSVQKGIKREKMNSWIRRLKTNFRESDTLHIVTVNSLLIGPLRIGVVQIKSVQIRAQKLVTPWTLQGDILHVTTWHYTCYSAIIYTWQCDILHVTMWHCTRNNVTLDCTTD
jgi:hypothetical protein